MYIANAKPEPSGIATSIDQDNPEALVALCWLEGQLLDQLTELTEQKVALESKRNRLNHWVFGFCASRKREELSNHSDRLWDTVIDVQRMLRIVQTARARLEDEFRSDQRPRVSERFSSLSCTVRKVTSSSRARR